MSENQTKVSINPYDSFVMMPFGSKGVSRHYFDELWNVVRGYFEGLGLLAHRADDLQLDKYLWMSVVKYMQAASAGVVVLDARGGGHVSPNVILELGYMLALGKPLLLLRERSAPELPSDILGHYRGSYASDRIDEDIPKHLEEWVRARGLIPPVVAQLARRLSESRQWVVDSELRRRHILLMNFADPDETFLFCVQFLCQLYRRRSANQFIQIILRPRRPRVLAEMLLRWKLGHDESIRFDFLSWARVKNATRRHLPIWLDPREFTRRWFSKVASQLPDGAECFIICENTSEYMRRVRNKGHFVEFEQSLIDYRDEHLRHLNLGVVCTYQWSDVVQMVGEGTGTHHEMIQQIVNCHDEILVFNHERQWLKGEEARRYLEVALAKLPNHEKPDGGAAGGS